jgi:hypothetical protein
MRKIFKKTIFIALIFQFSYWIPAFTQNVGISDAGASFTPDASSVLELKSTLRGLLIPRMTTAQRVTLGVVPAVAGLLVYDTDLTTFYYWDATATAQWRPLLASSRSSSVAGASAGWTTFGNAGTVASTNFIGTTDAIDLVFRTNNIEYMRMLSTGNIGIGSTAPSANLHIRNNLSGGSTMPLIIQNGISGNPAGTEVVLRLSPSASETVRGADISAYNNGANAIDLRFLTSNAAPPTEKMRITAGGQVGIANSAPQQALSITGGLNIDQGSAGTSTTFAAGAVYPALSFGSGSGEGITSKRTAGSGQYGLEFVTNSTNRMSIGSNGNIGIGTTTPAAVGAAKLEMFGTASSTAGPHFQAVTSTDTYPVLQNLNWNHDNISYNFDSYYDGAAWRSGYASSSFQMYKTTNALKFNYGIAAAGAALSWTEAMRINSTGSITIANAYSLPTAVGTSGQALVSGGATSSWGTLGVAGGGTGATSFTTGSVIFEGASALSEDNPKFFWDNTNYRLGIGNAAPDNSLHITSSTAGVGAHIGNGYIGNWDGGNTYTAFTYNGLKATTSSYALLQSSTGATYLNAATGTNIAFRINNADAMTVSSNLNVGIGTTGPLAALDVLDNGTSTTTNVKMQLSRSGAGDVGMCFNQIGVKSFGIVLRDNTTATGAIGRLAIVDSYFPGGAGNERMCITTPGYVGINCNDPKYTLHVVGDIASSGTVRTTSALVTGAITACSDIRYKKNIIPLENALEKVLKLNGVTYLWKISEFPNKNFSSKMQIGVIAQEVEKIYPQLVVTDTDGYKSVDYSKLTPILLEAIKEQQKMISTQQNILAEQQKALNKLKVETEENTAARKEMGKKMQQLDLILSAESKRH